MYSIFGKSVSLLILLIMKGIRDETGYSQWPEAYQEKSHHIFFVLDDKLFGCGMRVNAKRC